MSDTIGKLEALIISDMPKDTMNEALALLSALSAAEARAEAAEAKLAEALLNPDPWRPIEEAPTQDMACFVCRSKAVFTDYTTGQPASFGEVRDWAEKCEAAFWLNGQLHQAGTGHMYAEEDMSEEWQPTHWMPIPHFRELKGPGQ